MELGRPGYRDWAELLFSAGIATVCAWYVVDTYTTSSRAKNVILILPIGAIAVALSGGLCVTKAVALLRERQRSLSDSCTQTGKSRPDSHVLQTLMVTALFATYCVLVDVVGFDAVTFVFVLSTLLVLGERSKAMLLLYPALFTLVALKMVGLTSYDVPVLFEVMGR